MLLLSCIGWKVMTRLFEICLSAVFYLIIGVLFFGLDPKPFEILAVVSVMFLSMIYTALRDIYDKL